MKYLDPVIFSISNKQVSIRNADAIGVPKVPGAASRSVAAEYIPCLPVGSEPVDAMVAERRRNVATGTVFGDRHGGGYVIAAVSEIGAPAIRIDADDLMVPRVCHQQGTVFQRDGRMGLIETVQPVQQTPLAGKAENRTGDCIADQNVACGSNLGTGGAAQEILSDRPPEQAVRREYVNAMVVQIRHIEITDPVDGGCMRSAELISAATRHCGLRCRRPAKHAATEPTVEFQTGRQPDNPVALKFGNVHKPIAIDFDIEWSDKRSEDRYTPTVAMLFPATVIAAVGAKKIASTAQAEKRFSHGDDCRILAGAVNR